MGSEIGIKIRKVVVISIRGGYRSVCNHPFLVGFFGFLLLLYRSFPFLFSVLVSASPVLVCTAILLGTLLSFGQPNVPEVEKEEQVTHGISSFQAGFSEGDTVFADRDEGYFVKGYSLNRSDVEERGIVEASLVIEKDNKAEDDHGLPRDLPPDDENTPDLQPEKQEIREVERERERERELHSFELEKNREVHEENQRSEAVLSDDEAIEEQYVMVQKVEDDIVEIENEKTPGDHVDFSASSSWKQVENDDEAEDDSVESGSDGAESSSPDASMADIIPMLDELHPLLDLDAPQPAQVSNDYSDAASEKSQESEDDSIESDDDSENNCDAEDDDGIDEHDDEEEEVAGGKDDESKSAIKWTEDDQKNLMDLGNLELERNKRLENLIARRKARRLMTEKNLIDLDGVDIPCNVAPIATTRRNPFDFPDDSYAAMGLPPIPGSAPSILQPRRNPFDIPYDSNEEKPDLKGDSFQQEFTGFHQRDAIFRRHESFSLGPSVLGLSKQERYDWKPVFISERMASEGTSYSFQRQSSGASDSKLSSVPDTESVSSIDQDDRKFSEQDLCQETEFISNIDHASDTVEHGSQSSEENDSMEMIQAEESNVRHDEVEIVLGGVEDPSGMVFYPETGGVEIDEQFNAGERHLRREPSDEESGSSRRSSHSSLSEVIDSIQDEKMEKTENLEQGDDHPVESRISTQASVEESNFQHVHGEVEDNHHVEPVYDISPQASETLQSIPSVSSLDFAVEFSERALPPASVETTTNVADKESEMRDHSVEGNTSGHEQTQEDSSELHEEAKNESRSEKSEETNYVTANELSAVAPIFVDQNGSTVAELQVVPVPVDSNLFLDVGSIKDVTNSGLVHEQDLASNIHVVSEILHQENVDSPDSNYQMASEKSHPLDNESVEEGAMCNEVSRFDNTNASASVQDVDKMLDSVASDAHHISSNGSSLPAAQDLQVSLAAGQAPVVHPNLHSEETEHTEIISSYNNDGMLQIQKDEVLSSNVEQGKQDILQELDRNTVAFISSSQHELDVKSPSNLENHLSSSNKSVAAESSSNHDESQSSNAIQVEPAQGFGTSKDQVEELHDADDKFPPSISTVISEKYETPEFGSPTGEGDLEIDRPNEVEEDQNEVLKTAVASEEGSVSQVSEENTDEFDDMKEIDEGFLSELDTVGDFSVSNAGVSLHADIEHEKTRDAQLSSLPKDVEVEEVEQDIPVLEARSLEDIDLAFKQLQEGVDVTEVILPSTIKDQHVSEVYKDHPELNSDLQVVEARSLEDINNAIKQVSEGNKGELPNSLGLKDTSVKVEEQKVGSSKVNESFDAATSSEGMSRTPEDKLENVPDKGSSNDAKSHSRKSSSSSSSSSSDSD